MQSTKKSKVSQGVAVLNQLDLSKNKNLLIIILLI